MMSRTVFMTALCVLFCAHTLGAQGTCTLENVQGTYVNVVSIYAGTTPMSSIGLTKIDSTGHWEGPVVIVTPVGPVQLASAGEIEVRPDCTAEIIQYAGGYDHVWAAAILGNGKEIRSVHTDPATEPMPGGSAPTVRVQTLVRLSAGRHEVSNCSVDSLAGRYAKTCTGWNRTAAGYAPFASIAWLTSDGQGNGWGEGVMVAGGVKTPLTYEGLAYSVDAGCLGELSFTTEGAAYQERFAVFDEGKQAVSITLTADRIDVCRYVRMER